MPNPIYFFICNLKLHNSVLYIGATQGPGRAAMPAPGNMAAWRAGLWTRMEKLVNKAHEVCEKIYHLEKILAKKKDPVSHACFLESFSENGRSIILNNFWKMTMEMLADAINRSAQGIPSHMTHKSDYLLIGGSSDKFCQFC